jgi:UDP-N-acetylmuramoyl-tripeptide--D-alanyl-D-alanine ligase
VVIVNLTTQEVLKALRGMLKRGPEKRLWSSVSTDSRAACKDALFFALKGPRFDGHDFVLQAAQNGAQGAVVHRNRLSGEHIQQLPAEFTILEVDDPLKALGDIASTWRSRISPVVIGVTGSGGKTTTKEMAAEILSLRFSLLKNLGNLNNLVGLPLTLCQLEPTHTVALLEMGMNMPGEISRLCDIAQPNVGLITNVYHAHVGRLGTLEKVSQAKGEMLPYLSQGGTLIKNLDDEWTRRLGQEHHGRSVTYSLKETADVCLKRIEEKGTEGIIIHMAVRQELFAVHLHALGTHNVANALAAAAIGAALLVDKDAIRNGLEDFRPVDKRMNMHNLPGNIHLIDDSYNANPEAMHYALQTVDRLRKTNGGRLIAVLGDMKELGDREEAAHVSLGVYLADIGVDETLYLGPMYRHVVQGAESKGLNHKQLHVFEDHESMTKALKEEVRAHDWILVKASRSMELDRVARAMMGEEK